MSKKKIKKPTPVEVKAEIKKLKEMKPNVRRLSGFGDDHHAAIDVQVDVLEGNLSDDYIYGQWGEGAAEEERSENLLSSACDARRWLDGDGDGVPPSADWKCLTK